MRQDGLQWTKHFPWSRTAERTADVYRQVLQ